MRWRRYIQWWNILGALLVLCAACQHEKSDSVSAQPEESTPAESVSAQPEPTPVELDPWVSTLPGKLLFQSDRDGDWEIYVMNADGTNLLQLTHNTCADEYPVWSPDGDEIAFKSDRDGDFDIYIMNADGSQQRRITQHPAADHDPAWLPDGRRIAFNSDRDSGIEIYLINTDGSGLTQWTSTLGKNGLSAWSPDGKQVAYTGNRYLGWNVYVMNTDKSGDARLTQGHGACRPDWSPDSQQIAYVSQKADGKGDIWVMQRDGSNKTLLTTDDDNYDYYPAWSPDGQYIAYAKTSDKETGNWELYVMSADGSKHAQVLYHPAREKFPDWARGRISDDMVVRHRAIYEAELGPREIGKIQDDPGASGDKAVMAEPTGNKGFMLYGPYESYAPGAYIASFRVKTDHADLQKPVARLEVATEMGQTVVAEYEVAGRDFAQNGRYQDFEVPFSLDESRVVEFRVFFTANARVWIDYVVVSSPAGNK
jgi:Tol biopolymer transport system component